MYIVDEYKPREFTCFGVDGGIVLCDKEQGAFLVLRHPEDLENLQDLLKSIERMNDGTEPKTMTIDELRDM